MQVNGCHGASCTHPGAPELAPRGRLHSGHRRKGERPAAWRDNARRLSRFPIREARQTHTRRDSTCPSPQPTESCRAAGRYRQTSTGTGLMVTTS